MFYESSIKMSDRRYHMGVGFTTTYTIATNQGVLDTLCDKVWQ